MAKIQGMDKLRSILRTLSNEVQEDVRDVVEKTTLAIQVQAIRNAPAAGDNIATQHGQQKINTGINQFIGAAFAVESRGLSGEVFIESGATELAIYVEFGTGVSAAGYVPTLPKEFQEVARKYYINGKGTIIKAPFLLPAYFKESAKFVPELKKVLKDIKL